MRIETVIKIYEMLKSDYEQKKNAVDEVRERLPSIMAEPRFIEDYSEYDADLEAAEEAYEQAFALLSDFANTNFQL